jgi:hypothetical protein
LAIQITKPEIGRSLHREFFAFVKDGKLDVGPELVIMGTAVQGWDADDEFS